jgi:hypothetical protein
MSFFQKIIEMCEEAGRARAQRELHRHSYLAQYDIHSKGKVTR